MYHGYQGSQRNLYRLLVSRTFFQAQAEMLLIERGERLKYWNTVDSGAIIFLSWFSSNRVIRYRTSAAESGRLDRAGINFQLEHARGRMVFRNMVAIFEHSQE